MGQGDADEDIHEHQGLYRPPGAFSNPGIHTTVVPLTKNQRLTGFTVMCLVLNRTIGSGIFTAPAYILKGTGSISATLFLWGAGSIVSFGGLLVWLELSLSIPRRSFDGILRGVPRSGGEKNYLEEIYNRPKYLTTCLFGVIFIILGNLTGNAVAFGTYVLTSLGHSDPPKSHVLGIAAAALTTVTLLHVFSRRGGIVINNIFACVKVLILVVIIVLGLIVKTTDHSNRLGGGASSLENFDVHTSFTHVAVNNTEAYKSTYNDKYNSTYYGSYQTNEAGRNLASYVDAFLFVIYTYSGFEQPFYVLSEFQTPRKIFPKYSLGAMAIATVLFILVNVSFLCAVPAELQLHSPKSMGILFFAQMFGDKQAGERAMAALIAISILGNIVVMTFTASRVKQEIAKEGILPWSLFFATGTTTPWAYFKAWRRSRMQSPAYEDDLKPEQSPMAALALHWLSSVVLLGVTAFLDPTTSYTLLVDLYSYVIILIFGFFVSGGLLFLKVKHYFVDYPKWSPEFKPWFLVNPLHAVLYFAVCGFLLICVFLRPSDASPFSRQNSKLEWYIVPTIGLSSLLWGLVWYAGLHLKMAWIGRDLHVERNPDFRPDEDDDDEIVQYSEEVTIKWLPKDRSHRRPRRAENVDTAEWDRHEDDDYH